ncbi:hypothetical protein ZYGR_0AK06850 [Zygosaccharomyces rouxii]|uniref:Uncharacterized protein n=1 Tax=Zygosaccharomyces rouxii TaxID=4956 RepID=A0A1Q3AFD0_ZYGRO|nr:hypothetical protein ZYGR_0AK06850 [Zygosaccharomyces rouxii]
MGLEKMYSSSIYSNNSFLSLDYNESDATAISDSSFTSQFNESLNFQFGNEKTHSTSSTAIPEETEVSSSISKTPSELSKEHIACYDNGGTTEGPAPIGGLKLSVNFDPLLQSKIASLEQIIKNTKERQIHHSKFPKKSRRYFASKREHGKIPFDTSELTSNKQGLTSNSNSVNVGNFATDFENKNHRMIDHSQRGSISRKKYNKVFEEKLENSLVNRELTTRIAGLSQLVTSLNHIHNETMRKLQDASSRAQKLENALISVRHHAEKERDSLHQKIDDLNSSTEKIKSEYEKTISKLTEERSINLKQLKSKLEDERSAMEDAQKCQSGKLICMSPTDDLQDKHYELQRKVETFVQMAPYGTANEVLIDKDFYEQLISSYSNIRLRKSFQNDDQQRLQDLQAQHEEMLEKFSAQRSELEFANQTVQMLYSTLSGTASVLRTESFYGEETGSSNQDIPTEELQRIFSNSKWRKANDGDILPPKSWSFRNGKRLKLFGSAN